ncbi:Uncharacterised protein [Vibrio cholerae]|nr:Uncharacterised protein [Vibrio cholerae]CSI55362.1 Uncharacterised protein [Vibrio cholerae]CSI58657.1 Uncharacterised protein [Vibrio cholerae]
MVNINPVVNRILAIEIVRCHDQLCVVITFQIDHDRVFPKCCRGVR